MNPSFARSLRLLAVDALRDALRRRTILAVMAVCVLSVMGFDSCTSFWSGEVEVNGEAFRLEQISQYAGLPMLSILAVGLFVLAGILASDELSRPLEDGTANLWLARPVTRTGYALSRLLGALCVTWGVGAILLGSAAGLLSLRQGLPLGPAGLAALASALGATTAAALAMTASLYLPRIAVILLGAFTLFFVSWGNIFALIGAEPGGSFGLADRFGPPFLSSIALALWSWTPDLPMQLDPPSILLRLLLWPALSIALLLVAFRRHELPR